MVRIPLSPAQIEAGRRLGALVRDARGDTELTEIAARAGISPETLRKIEAGRIPSPGFGTVVGLCDALGISLDEAVGAWRGRADTARAVG
ncbi:helix-turn-helix domain-containing protein [Gordonia liuliyuniae]|uniref:Helix-turn-helix domain-containing protein n=1 Tax=Gordonia liuliyuniae TaxID=2911517 RepID=A0ABS9IRE8_9ACTN|nr:helix-turn-helix transcriptional regulator [Gordonia liuliyuniae]MCF8588100.1 helix-turn-helix domain-containing protein [Gordonia liuliyuniae]